MRTIPVEGFKKPARRGRGLCARNAQQQTQGQAAEGEKARCLEGGLLVSHELHLNSVG